ncbi:MAG: hypothetical protein JW941_08020 [Candidatus Coatesbacteria bacterium]|nr:hypothetical protein [Candidatus Coatesbacteria bacterium]
MLKRNRTNGDTADRRWCRFSLALRLSFVALCSIVSLWGCYQERENWAWLSDDGIVRVYLWHDCAMLSDIRKGVSLKRACNRAEFDEFSELRFEGDLEPLGWPSSTKIRKPCADQLLLIGPEGQVLKRFQRVQAPRTAKDLARMLSLRLSDNQYFALLAEGWDLITVPGLDLGRVYYDSKVEDRLELVTTNDDKPALIAELSRIPPRSLWDHSLDAKTESEVILARLIGLCKDRLTKLEYIELHLSAKDDFGNVAEYDIRFRPGCNYVNQNDEEIRSAIATEIEIVRDTASGKKWRFTYTQK